MCYRIGARAHNRKKRFASGERWREIVTSMDVAWGSGGARASGLRLTQLHGLWWRIYGLGSRERCLPENQASPSTDPFLSSSYSLPPFFSFHFLQFLVFFSSSSSSLFPLLIWSRQTRDGYSRTTSIRTTPPSLSNRFVNSCKDSSFGIDTIFFYDFCTLFEIFVRLFLGLTMMMHGPRARGEY